jgi:hypothetical protein
MHSGSGRGRATGGPRRLIAFVVFSSLVAAAAAGYVAWRAASEGRDAASLASESGTAPARADTTPLDEALLDSVRARPHVYYRSTRASEFGRLVVAALDAPDDTRAVTGVACERLTAGVSRGVCLVDNRQNLQPPALARLLDRGFAFAATVDLPGYPSRTRLSRDERYAATTVFVSGERYAGSFATRTHIIDMAKGAIVAELEQFTTYRDGRPFSAVDFNFWGVTFTRDANRFYATLATGGKTYLVVGDLSRRRFDVLRENVECPSLSPDERHLAFKSRRADGDGWRLHVLDLTAMEEWPVAGETRSVDDQVEWLDDARILYHVREDIGSPEVAVNVWVSAIARESTEPARIFIHSAMSPAIVRPIAAGAQ